jgi:2-haloalkanoic acid dehalogenase type II
MTVPPKHGEAHSNPVDRRTNAQWIGGKPSVLIFDVNETLIDFESMNPLFKRVFGDERVLREWLGHLIMYSMTLTLSGLYKDFFSLGQGLFEMVGTIHKVEVKPADIEALKKGMLTMPAHADVKEGLKQLKDAGFRMVTLTNSPPNKGGKTPLENAGLADYFERQFSVEAARAYKPAQVLYHMVAQELEVPPSAWHDRGARLGHDRGAERRPRRRPAHPARQRATARAWAAAAERRRTGLAGPRRQDDQTLAVLIRPDAPGDSAG